MEIDLNAPIIPFKGLGGIELYTSKKVLAEFLDANNAIPRMLFEDTIRYEIKDECLLFFNVVNDKLYKLTATGNYKGSVFGKIKIGMSEEELLEAEPSFVYDDFEEVWISDKGIFIEMDPETNKVMWISVYVPELDTEDFEKGNW